MIQIRSLISVIALSAGLLTSVAAVAAEPKPVPHPQVELKTNLGNIVVELYPEAAPKTVKNFLQYVKSGYYNGTIFHRVIDNFMIQGGGMGKDLKEKKTGAPIPLEAQFAMDHGLKNDNGTIAMAREEKPDTATAQFYINVADNDFLNPMVLPDGDPVQVTRHGTQRTMRRAEALQLAAGYTPFGRVVDGMDVVYKIKLLKTSAHGEYANVPIDTVTVLSAKILKTPITPKTIDEQLGIKPAESAPVNAPTATPIPDTTPEPETVPAPEPKTTDAQ